jgi:hypothetical protein
MPDFGENWYTGCKADVDFNNANTRVLGLNRFQDGSHHHFEKQVNTKNNAQVRPDFDGTL